MGWFRDRADDAPDPGRVARLEERVRRLELTVARLLSELGEDPAPGGEDPWAEARALKARGKPIEAVKAVREATGMGLREAKELVDRL